MKLFDRIKTGLKRTRDAFSGRMDDLVESYRELDDDFYEELTDILIMADIGMATTQLAVDRLKKQCAAEKIVDAAKARDALKEILAEIVRAEPLELKSPMVLIIVGVNGVGKTTTIGKLAARFKLVGRSVLICAADTFRAAAADQLTVWAERADAPIIKHQEGADPAAVVFDAVQAARARAIDIMLVDTAGRLHNKAHLMEELRKISRVVEREFPEATTKALLVIDANTGQNGLTQAKMFSGVADIDGIVLTKLDSTAKGGIAVAIANEMGMPVRYIGVGEQLDDLQPFEADAFLDAIFGE
ncbi:MAG: signal recognition particle-docking protein FtsY [Christensenellales bacterium]